MMDLTSRLRRGLVLSSALFLAVTAGAAQAPVVVGLHGRHGLNDQQIGQILIRELRCAACHGGLWGGAMTAAPVLTEVGGRLAPDFLQHFIADPAAVQPGTTMPSLLGALPEADRTEISTAISHYLVSLNGTSFDRQPPAPAEIAAGAELFHTIGCVACHSPRDAAGVSLLPQDSISLSHVPGKYSLASLTSFLFEPLRVRPGGRMPDMRLTRDEAGRLAAYLLGSDQPDAKALQPDGALAKKGQSYFRQFNCAACHTAVDAGQAPKAAPGLKQLTGGCLAETPKGVPDFHLDDGQRSAIAAALATVNDAVPPGDEIHLRLVQLNCIGCHVRNDFGGVAPNRDAFFHSTEEALGNESRIPPPLTKVGGKLRPEWLNKVLYDGETVRPYMQTRMPQFGAQALTDLSALLVQIDAMPEMEMPAPEGKANGEMRKAANSLLGDKGLNCIACHNFNGKASPGMKGLDLMTTFQRLQPGWFYQYMQNPAAVRPGIIMPSYWPGGVAVQKEILGGDMDAQLRALWYYFSLGRSASDPSGIESPRFKLDVTTTPRTYRGRSGIAGFRGIAVGFPGGLNYAFNAQNGALSGLWQGEFVTANWGSQGAGDFNPIGRALQLAQDVAFIQLKDEQAPWPLRPLTTKEQPVIPDPLYPRQYGYAFAGYFFDEAEVPTLLYRSGEISISDRSVSVDADGRKVLRRTFTFDSPSEQILYFRALTGKVQVVGGNSWSTEDVMITGGAAVGLLRNAAAGEGDNKELLIKLTIPKGNSTYTLDYGLLR